MSFHVSSSTSKEKRFLRESLESYKVYTHEYLYVPC